MSPHPASTLVAVIGGSGFLGHHVVRRLARAGYRLRVATRNPTLANAVKPLGDAGQIALVRADIRDEAAIAAAVAGAQIVVNLVGVLRESGGRTFQAMHADGAGIVARAAAAAGAHRLIHVSSIGARADSRAAYARSKAEGEAQVRKAFPGATILRPSIIFGAGDGFFNRFAGLMRALPRAIPLFGGGRTKFQPVFAGDVAEALVNALANDRTRGKTYELGGPAVYTLRQLLEFVAAVTERKRAFFTFPFFALDIAAMLTGWLPFAPLTLDQARLLRIDNVVKAGPGADFVGTLADLGVQPTAIETFVPTYLRSYRRAGQYTVPRGA